MRDIYSEQVILFGLAMEGPTTWLRQHKLSPIAWADQAAVVAQRYRIPAGIVRQQAFRVSPRAHDELIDVEIAA